MKYLIAGLGNIGSEYENTRHNIGFNILDELAFQNETPFQLDRLALHGIVKFKGRQLHLIKPTTYMNLSGKAVKFWMNKLKVTPEQVLVVTDDIALPLGKIRIRAKGSDGGHNGLKSVQEALGTNNYPRLRFGVGSDFHKGQQVNYVLGAWEDDEVDTVNDKIGICVDAIKSFSTVGLERTMNLFNNK